MGCAQPTERTFLLLSVLLMICGTLAAAVLAALAGTASDVHARVVGVFIYTCFGLAFCCDLVIMLPQLRHAHRETVRAAPHPWMLPAELGDPLPAATAPPLPQCGIMLLQQPRSTPCGTEAA
jgi:hypothetical protein